MSATPNAPQPERLSQPSQGPLAWMAKNSVAANLLMTALLVGGLIMLGKVRQEVFPEFELDMVLVSVPYPGASPAEVEQGVVLAIEEAVRGLDGVKEISSVAAEGAGVVQVELLLTANNDRVLADIKSAVDRITSFPLDIERPIISLASRRREVISLVISGDLPERSLRNLADRARNELLADPRITLVELAGVRPLEISVEIPRETLRAHNLTLEAVANRIRAASVEVPSGGVKTQRGEILVRTTERRDLGAELEDITLFSRRDGTRVRLGDVATVMDGFADTDQEAYFNGRPAAMVQVFRTGDQKPLEIAQAVREYIEVATPALPPGVHLATWSDASKLYGERIDLLKRSAYAGLVLVLLILGMFLHPRLALWVTVGIGVAFLGAMILLPKFDVSVNMISLFAFIVVLGVVVDDAIVVGEAIYHRRESGLAPLPAAIAGVRDVAAPVVFSVLTTVIAFAPLLFVPGIFGKFFRHIPLVVIAVLTLSLVESLLILPSHLGHSSEDKTNGHGLWARVTAFQARFSAGLHRFVDQMYRPVLRAALRRRYFTFSIAVALLLGAFGIVKGGHLTFTSFPRIDSDRVTASLRMPFGAHVNDTKRVAAQLTDSVHALLAELEQEHGHGVSLGIFTEIGGATLAQMGRGSNPMGSTSHVGTVSVYLVPSDERMLSAQEFARRWREVTGDVHGVDALWFRFSTGPSAQSAINVDLSHSNLDILEEAASELAGELGQYAGVRDVDAGFQPGKEQLDLKLTPHALALGLSESDLARQLRSAFFGAEAIRQQRGREEVRTFVRLPRHQRVSEHDIETLLVRTPDGGEIPLSQAARVRKGRSFKEIQRIEGRRVVTVSGDIVPGQANAERIVATMGEEVFPALAERYPGLVIDTSGDQKERRRMTSFLGKGQLVALLVMYGLLAIAFQSYIQPMIIMLAIPFGFIGAFVGHVLLGYDLSMISLMGVVALSGIVINDSLVLIHATNLFRSSENMSAIEAIEAGATRRFRPILLTSLTTFFGLTPMILETSMQARFLIPMAISLSFGVLFATGVILMVVPAVFMIVEDCKALGRRGLLWLRGAPLWDHPQDH